MHTTGCGQLGRMSPCGDLKLKCRVAMYALTIASIFGTSTCRASHLELQISMPVKK